MSDSAVDYTSDPNHILVVGYDWQAKFRFSRTLENCWHCDYSRMLPGINMDSDVQKLTQ